VRAPPPVPRRRSTARFAPFLIRRRLGIGFARNFRHESVWPAPRGLASGANQIMPYAVTSAENGAGPLGHGLLGQEGEGFAVVDGKVASGR
jgi:hypothetical protein